MGIEKVVFYSVKCDRCKNSLEDYETDVPRSMKNRTIAAKVAENNGFLKIRANTWLCPKCAKMNVYA